MSKKNDIIALLVRLIIGGIFVVNGYMKVTNMTMTLGYFHALGIPTFLTYIVAYCELIGGILVVLGLFTHYAAKILGIIMVFAIYFSLPGGFPVYSLPLSVLAGLLSIIAAGPGAYAVRTKKMMTV